MIRLTDLRAALVLGVTLVVACKGRNVAQARAAAEASAAAELARGDSSVPASRGDSAQTTFHGHIGKPQLLQFTVSDAGITGPDTVLTGPVEFRVTNTGTVGHELRFLKMGRATLEMLRTEMARDNGNLPPLEPNGGVGPVMPGQTVSVVQLLEPANYAVVSTNRAADGTPWYRKGLLRLLRVTGTLPPNYVIQPPVERASAVLLAIGSTWRFGSSLTRGEDRSLQVEGRMRRTEIEQGDITIGVEFRGGAPHDLVVMRASGPGAMREYLDWMDGAPRPLEIVGGIPSLNAKGTKSYLRVHLAPGPYIVFCPQPVRSREAGEEFFGFQTGEYAQFVVK